MSVNMVKDRNNPNDKELEKNKIKLFLNEKEVEERDKVLYKIESINKEIKKLEKHIYYLKKNKIKLLENKKGKYYKVNFSQYILDNFNREELIAILDDFIQYKDYFENPPKEAYEMDRMEYSKCEEAHEMERLLYKYEIFDSQYNDKLRGMERKYNKREPDEFSREKLYLDEIFAVLTWLHRGERHCGAFFNEAIEKKTFYNLLKRMEEIRNELYY